MTTVDPTLWDGVLADAREHAERGNVRQATQLLARMLRGHDPATTMPDHLLLDVAALYARVAGPHPDAPTGRPDEVAWARYAVQAARTLHGRYHPVTLDVTNLLASVLAGRGRSREADEVRQQLIALHLEHGAVSASFWARLDLACQRHGRGQCADAHRDAEQIWQEWMTRFGTAGRLSALLALQASGMLLACGRAVEAQPYLDIADRHIPAQDDPDRSTYATYLLALCITAIDHRRVCAFTRGGLTSSTRSTERPRYT
nr:hypothetical protein GCM10020063_010000 [Dactylosporangium thailandense]